MSNTYIHYGHDNFHVEMFNSICNRAFVKPSGGLWASNINAKYGWKDWCKDEDFRYCNEDNYFKFKLKDNAKVLTIDNSEMLSILPKESSPFNFGWVTLDFEKLEKQYDAIELLISSDRDLYWKMYGWDCDSILIMNKEIIEVIEGE